METEAPPKRSPKPLPAGIQRELEKQREAVYEARVVLQCVVTAMEDHFTDWPPEIPLFNYALRVVANLLDDVATALYEEEFTAAVAAPNGRVRLQQPS